ncbi:LysM and putative peptidoglycan-binding domain-containing protein 1 [Aphelenchoides fujianensis]|nr:LysM and putative peptidoglycan-binding domain-containing protein 1 [Aphelenchoides fujianensis]
MRTRLKYTQVITHEVRPEDTLQSLELKYNSSMFEIKRLNRLWSNDSLHCKTHVSIPLFDETRSAAATPNAGRRCSQPEDGRFIRKKRVFFVRRPPFDEKKAEPVESMDAFFKRIDGNVKQTKKAVRKLNKRQ